MTDPSQQTLATMQAQIDVLRADAAVAAAAATAAAAAAATGNPPPVPLPFVIAPAHDTVQTYIPMTTGEGKKHFKGETT